MSIILNEREYARDVIASRDLGAHPLFELGLAAKYFAQVDGFSGQALRDRIEEFFLSCTQEDSVPPWYAKKLESLAKEAESTPLVVIDGIDVTEDELRVVVSEKGLTNQKLLFSLLCVAKYWNARNPANDNWVNTKDGEISSLANLTIEPRKRNEILRSFRDAGYIKFSKRVDNLNMQVCFCMEDSPACIHITDFCDIGNQYMRFVGYRMLNCQDCGRLVRCKSNRQKYCSKCARAHRKAG
jgi:hypothetical protein